jgi:UDP-glucose 4-epimerase
MNTNKKCIVFGANGYIGSHLIHFLKIANFNIKASDIHDKCYNSDIDYKKIDILNIENFKGINWAVDYVFAFAGVTGTIDGFENYEKSIKVNEIGLLNILNEIRNSNYNPRVIYPSSRLVYKGSCLQLKEDDPKEPKTVYALNKITCENILFAYKNTFDIPYTIYRIGVLYGNNLGTDYSFGTIGNFLNQAKKNKIINVYGDGSLRRTFTHIEDVCQQIIMSCVHNKSVNQIYNTIGEAYSLSEIASMIAGKYNSETEFSKWPEKNLKIESGHTIFNSHKLRNGFNIELKNSFKNWLINITLA